MAYQAKRHKQFTEEFELADEEGNVMHTLKVYLNADDMVANLNRKYVALTGALSGSIEARKKAQNNEDLQECMEVLGKATTDLFEAVFGEDDTRLIVDFYENRYVEMVKEVTPFITKCVIPRCIEIKKENQKSILQSYNRKRRRGLFGKVK